jgi:hypothetical protein
MLTLVLDVECESLLKQTAADLDLSPQEAAKVLLESSLLMSLTR